MSSNPAPCWWYDHFNKLSSYYATMRRVTIIIPQQEQEQQECEISTHICLLGTFCTCLLSITLLITVYLLLKRRWTRLQLSSEPCNLPTVLWKPKFWNYNPLLDDNKNDSNIIHNSNNNKKKKMASSTITNILPRMERLNGPYGMYATVYGISTKVLHVAHPIPARLVLHGSHNHTTTKTNQKQHHDPNRIKNNNKKTYIPPAGSIKTPAYNHFKNFSGDGVFTADGIEWKMKRSSVLHCLLKGCTRDDSKESRKLEYEANEAADSFIKAVCYDCKVSKTSNGNDDIQEKDGVSKDHNENANVKQVNIVPLLQRSTVGLIYRFITHHYVNFHQRQQQHEHDQSDVDTATTYNDDEDDNNSAASGSTVTSTSSTDTPTSSSHKTVQKNKNKNKNHQLPNNLPTKMLSAYLQAVTNIRMIILAQSRSIWFLLPRWMYRTFSPMYQAEEHEMTSIRDFARAACTNSQPGSPLYLLRSRESHNPNDRTDVVDGSVVNQELMDEAITLLFAGQDTTAATLSWTLHLLSLYPKVKERLVKEIESVLGAHGNSDVVNEEVSNDYDFDKCVSSPHPHEPRVTKKMIGKMPYLDAVIKESMRLYPVAPFVVRRLQQDLQIPSPATTTTSNQNTSSVVVPDGTFVCVWIYSLHRNKQLWNQPNDFLPERWIDPELRKLDPAQSQPEYNGTYMPFAAGPRNCVGQPLAQVILRIILARVVNECVFENTETSVIERDLKYARDRDQDSFLRDTMDMRKDMQAGFTVLPSGGVPLSFQKR